MNLHSKHSADATDVDRMSEIPISVEDNDNWINEWDNDWECLSQNIIDSIVIDD